VLEAALRSGAEAVHPGYGFLSESSRFAAAVIDAGLAWIGPSPDAIERMGDKVNARNTMAAAGVPVAAGTTEPLHDVEAAVAAAREIGFPLMVKAVAGGGGIGMAVADDEAGLRAAFETARTRAQRFFGSPSILIERYIPHARHVEVQVLGLADGRVVALGERDCSVQRRHQKIIEETPSPALTEAARQELCSRAVRAVVEAGYENLSTLEFLVDAKGDAYFIEINCRIQVEHPITEMCTGIDMVAMQIAIAAGEPLGMTQADVVSEGHAIEFRILAEDPGKDFRPQSGQILGYLAPGGPGVRMDTHIYAGYEVPSYYDSLLGKLSVWAPDRSQAIARGDAALRELLVDGITTNIDLHRAILANEVFIDGKVTTNLLDRVGSAPFVAAGNR
jgi:acetyl-CoA carboxylase biotin carboxylase subunit